MRAEPEPAAHGRPAQGSRHRQAGVPGPGLQAITAALNPYAAPKSRLEDIPAAGEIWREGNLVRMERGGDLPARCIACNQPAPERVKRKLYWSPPLWRAFALATPFALLFGGLALGAPLLAVWFWPSALLLAIVHLFVRTAVRIEVPVCARHRRLRSVLMALSVACILIVALGPSTWDGGPLALWLLWGGVLGLLVLMILQGFLGMQAVSLKRVSPAHLWLGGTGRAFREALPELPG